MKPPHTVHVNMDDGGVREMAYALLGGNCTFIDDDLVLLGALARAAIEAGLARGVVHESVRARAEGLAVSRAVQRLAQWCAQ